MRSVVSEIKKHYILFRVKSNTLSTFLKDLYKLDIDIYKINYINEDEIIVKVLSKDYKKIRKFFKNYRIRKVKELGIYRLKPFIKKHKIILFSLILGIILLFTLSKIVIKVEIIHSKKEIRELLGRELEEYGIKRLTFKKNYQSIQKIKQEILDKYPDRLEWIEIEEQGMNYRVRIEERILTEPEIEKTSCHIISTKDAIITKIVAYQGETLKRIDNYVKKNDIIISGIITLNENTKNTVCAKGNVYGEVWYTVSVSVPLTFNEHITTGEKRFNIMYESTKNKQSIFRSRFKDFNVYNKLFFSLFGTKFYLQTELEYKVTPKVYTETEAIERGNELAKEKMLLKLSDNDEILTQKVLKKTINNSTMNLEIFFAVNELISATSEFEILSEQIEQ